MKKVWCMIMKSKIIKIVTGIVICAAVIFGVVFFQFEKNKKDDETITAESTAPATTQEQTTLPAGEGEASSSVQTTVSAGNETPATTLPATQTVPSDKAGIINLYNTALGKSSGLKRTSYKRTLTQCKVGFPVGDKTNDSKVQALANRNDTTPAASDLVKLNEAMVASASSRVDGKTAVLEIALNQKDSDKNVKKGDGGYVGIVDFAETSELVKNIAKEALGLDTALKDNPVYHLTEGKYIVKINLDTGAITGVEFSCQEGGEGRVSITSLSLGIAIQAAYTA
jgi:hypothetical protein